MVASLRKNLQFSRAASGGIMISAAILLLAIAVLIEKMGLSLGHTRPLAFVGTVVAVKLGLFALWPSLSRFAKARSDDVLGDVFKLSQAVKKADSRSITLWDENSSRLSSALFATNLPTFILGGDQRLLDWNAAFELVFGAEPGLKRGAAVSAWYQLLDNFRRVPVREAKLHGGGILPITDRERAVYVSAKFGRMVFTKVMAPLIDLASGRIVGWSVVLNVNSVHHRSEFFTALQATLEDETRRIRYGAGYDRLFDQFSGRRELIEKHVSALAGARRILDVGCGTGSFSAALLAEGHRVTGVDGDPHVLRQARLRCAGFLQGKIVRKSLDQLTALPEERYDGAVLCYHLQTVESPAQLLGRLHATLKPKGLLVVTLRADGSTIDDLYAAVASQLEHKQAYNELKHQLEHVRSAAQAGEAARVASPLVNVGAACAQLEASGFVIDKVFRGLEDGQSLLLVTRKS